MKENKNRYEKRPQAISPPLISCLVPLSEAMLGVLLPLSLEIVGTDISNADNVGACCGERGGGWTTKKHEM